MNVPGSAGGIRRAWPPLGLALALALLGALAAGSAPTAGAGPPAPNVVVVMTDDQRADDMDVLPQTRQLLARRGVRFRNAFATQPLCCPSRATYLTGQYPHNHGVRDNKPPAGGAAIFRDSGAEAETIAVALDDAGYRTAWLGKYLNGYASLAREDPPHVPPGYDVWRAQASRGRLYGWRQMTGGAVRRWGHRPAHYQTDVLARQASRLVSTSVNKGVPFFLTVATLAPHVEQDLPRARRNPRPAYRHRRALLDDPLRRTPAFNEADVSDKPSHVRAFEPLDRTERERVRRMQNDRRASLLAVDDLVVRVMGALRDARAVRDTLVVFTSDNGFLLGEHRLRSRKDELYDEAAKVPLLARGPGLPQGERVDALVGNIDLAATIYDASGAAPLVAQDGVSLFDVAADPSAYDDRELLIETKRGSVTGLRTAEFLYGEHGVPAAEFELYDLEADPFQLRSVHDDPAYAARRAQLAARLAALRDCAGSSCR